MTGCRLADRTPKVVLDTNVFVGAGFNPRSHSALLLDAVRDGRLHMVWDDAIHEEIEHVLRRIPGLSWGAVAAVFRDEDRFDGDTHPDSSATCPTPRIASSQRSPTRQACHWLLQIVAC
jgi:hypothetical protein